MASVPVNDPCCVRGLERGGDLEHDGNRFLRGELPLFMDQALEVTPLHVLHGDELDSLGLPQIENADHVAMRYFAGQDQLLFEAAQNFSGWLASSGRMSFSATSRSNSVSRAL